MDSGIQEWLDKYQIPLQLKQEIVEAGEYVEVSAGTEIVRLGQYINAVPLVIEGAIKVVSAYDERELLLYYIKANETCVMSFASGIWNQPSRIVATAEKDTRLLKIPVQFVMNAINTYPTFGEMYFREFNKRYLDLIQTIHLFVFESMDVKLLEYLRAKADVLESDTLKLTHQEIANDMGTAREVVSRLLKRLVEQGVIEQYQHQLIILSDL